MKKILFSLLIRLAAGIFYVLHRIALATYANPVYSSSVQPHVGLALVSYNSLAHIPRFNAVFLCVPFGIRLSMVKLEGDIFGCAGILTNQLTNPFQLCHHHLVMNGKASIQSLGAHTHA